MEDINWFGVCLVLVCAVPVLFGITSDRRRLKKKNCVTLKRIILLIGLIFLTNLNSFVTVAMEKHLSKYIPFFDGYSAEQAAVVNSLSAVPVIYRPGFHIGHVIFYKDDNFKKTAEEQIGLKSLF